MSAETPSKEEQARLAIITATRLMRTADTGIRDSCLALIKAERILGAHGTQNAIQSQRVRAEALGRDLSSLAATLTALTSTLGPPTDS